MFNWKWNSSLAFFSLAINSTPLARTSETIIFSLAIVSLEWTRNYLIRKVYLLENNIVIVPPTSIWFPPKTTRTKPNETEMEISKIIASYYYANVFENVHTMRKEFIALLSSQTSLCGFINMYVKLGCTLWWIFMI